MSKDTQLALFLLLIFLIFPISATAQMSSDWTSFTQMNGIRSIDLDPDGNFWCATEGGATRFNPQTGVYDQWTNTDGLLSNNLQAVAVSESGEVWFGSAGDGLSKYSVAEDSWVYYTADFREAIANVHTILFNGEDAWFGTDQAGVHILREGPDPGDYIDDEWDLYNTGLGLGDNTVRAVLIAENGDFWFGTTAGVSIRSSATGEWSYLTTDNSSLENNIINDIAQDPLGRIWIASQTGLNRYQNGQLIAFGGPTRDMRAIAFDDTVAVVATNRSIYRYWYDAREVISPSDWDSYDVVKDEDGMFWFAVEGIGLVSWDPVTAEWSEHPINAPVSKSFTHVAIDQNRIVWTTTGLRPVGPDAGFNRLDPATGEWQAYNEANSLLPMDRTTGIAIDGQNRKFIANYNAPGGITMIPADESQWTVLSPQNTGMANSNILDVVVDDDQNLWIITYGSGVDVTPLASNFSEWYNFTRNEPNGGISDPDGAAVAIANYNDGLLLMYRRFGSMDFLDYGSDFGNKGDDQWTRLALPDFLTVEDVGSIAIDQNNYVWLGCQTGIGRFSGSSITQWGDETYWDDSEVLGGTPVNHIMVDQDNNKWFATDNDGLYFFIDAEAEFVHFNRANSDLPDNTVYWTAEDVYTDSTNRIIWIATSRGLSRMELIQQGGDNPPDSAEIYAFPNPFNVHLGHEKIAFYGIPDKSEVKVFTSSGDLVREWNFKFQNDEILDGQLDWDVKNEAGERVAPGIYFFSVITPGQATVVGKFAVLR